MRLNRRPPSWELPSCMARQKAMEFRPYARWILQSIARIARNTGGAYSHRNPALRVDEQKPAFVGQIVADEDRLAAGKRRACQQGGNAFSLVVAGLLELGDHLAFLHRKTGLLREEPEKRQDLIAEFRRLPEMDRERRAFVLQP